jgi:hypothetical protein
MAHPGLSRKKSEERAEFDLYETPAVATEQLLKHFKLETPIWEPACGRGAICRVLEKAGYRVTGSDLNNHGFGKTGVDFLETTRTGAKTIITNPPYLSALEFCEHSLSLLKDSGGNLFMLLRLDFLCSKGRRSFFLNSPLLKVLVFSSRLRFPVPGSKRGRAAVNYAWYVWRDGYKGQATISWTE